MCAVGDKVRVVIDNERYSGVVEHAFIASAYIYVRSLDIHRRFKLDELELI